MCEFAKERKIRTLKMRFCDAAKRKLETIMNVSENQKLLFLAADKRNPTKIKIFQKCAIVLTRVLDG